MSEKPKPDLTKSVVGKMIGDELAKIREEQARKDAEQDAKLERPSRAVQAVKALDITERYPIPAWAIGVAFVVGALVWLDGVKLYIGAGVGVCFVPGLAGKVVRLATGLKKAKGE